MIRTSTASRRPTSPSPSDCDIDDEVVIDEVNNTNVLNGVSNTLENRIVGDGSSVNEKNPVEGTNIFSYRYNNTIC